jgi:nitrogen fixation/metabolism regulation signal transduction histidine kinase
VQPLKSLIRCFSRLATGDIGQINVAADRGDEIGDLGRTYEGFRQLVLDTHAARDRAREQEEVVESERSRAGMEKARLDEV